MPVERRTEGVGLALWWTRQRDRNYLRKRGGGRPLGPGMEGPRVEPGKPEGRRSSLSGGGNRKERPCTRLERASGDSNRRILKTVRPVVWEGAGAQSPALDPITPPLHVTSFGILHFLLRIDSCIRLPKSSRPPAGLDW